jgi:hypothetical protein
MGAFPTVPLPLLTSTEAKEFRSFGVQAQNAPELVKQVQDVFEFAQAFLQAISTNLTLTILELDVQGCGSGGQWGAQILASFTRLDDPTNPLSGIPVFFDALDGGGLRQLVFFDCDEATSAAQVGVLATDRILTAPVPDVPPPAPPMTPQKRIPLAWTVAAAGDANKYLAGFVFLQASFGAMVPPAFVAALQPPRSAASMAERSAFADTLPADWLAGGRAILAAAKKADPKATIASVLRATARKAAPAAKVAPKVDPKVDPKKDPP